MAIGAPSVGGSRGAIGMAGEFAPAKHEPAGAGAAFTGRCTTSPRGTSTIGGRRQPCLGEKRFKHQGLWRSDSDGRSQCTDSCIGEHALGRAVRPPFCASRSLHLSQAPPACECCPMGGWCGRPGSGDDLRTSIGGSCQGAALGCRVANGTRSGVCKSLRRNVRHAAWLCRAGYAESAIAASADTLTPLDAEALAHQCVSRARCNTAYHHSPHAPGRSPLDFARAERSG